MSRMIIRISSGELYRYCADFGLMLSWGIPIMKVLDELEKKSDHVFLKRVSRLTAGKILTGNSISEAYQDFPEIFKPVFNRWVRIGERFGILDEVFLKLAGLFRFSDLLTENESLKRELARFLIRGAEIVRNNKYYGVTGQRYGVRREALKELLKLTEDPLLVSWIKGSDSETDCRLFDVNMIVFHTTTLYRRIAKAAFWHLLGTAESAGFLPDMMESLGLYLDDERNLYPDDKALEIDMELFKSSFDPFRLAGTIIHKGAQWGSFRIIIDGGRFRVEADGKEEDFADFMGLKDSRESEMRALVNGLKLILDLDPAEQRLEQKCRKEIEIDGLKFEVKAEISPTFPFEEGELFIKLPPEKERPEIITLKVREIRDEK